ncbi:MAG: DUF4573 domain-containing protein [Prevotella sp.]|nr:DUF4573 domain-containing protein [Prevotella sp.]
MAKPLGTVAMAKPLGTVAMAKPLGTVAMAKPLGTVAMAKPLGIVAMAKPLDTEAVIATAVSCLPSSTSVLLTCSTCPLSENQHFILHFQHFFVPLLQFTTF